ncbi:MAG TPA: protein kinase, partial [Blastocatellia bacterium]|nr:protein kinase [Blastocatellia bacterium]
ALNHPNIITIHEIGHADGVRFIVAELIEGQTLRQRLSGGKIDLREGLNIAIQAASALGAAHTAGIVHRDVKPENLMLRPDGVVKILDFGLAKVSDTASVAGDTDSPTLVAVESKTGLVIGTGSYMSPEQIRGLKVDARSDIFSLGVVLYEIAAGRRPFEGATLGDVAAAILKENPATLRQHSPEVPAELDWMVKKALAKDREERYQGIKELEIDLKRLKHELALREGMGVISRTVAVGRESEGSDDSPFDKVARATEAGVSRSAESEIKRRHSAAAGLARTAIISAVLVVTFSVASFYAGLKLSSPPPTVRQLTFRRGSITTARFAPDGQTIVYSAAFGGRPIELFTSRLEGSRSGSLGLRAGVQAVSSTNELAILRDCLLDFGECHEGTLASVPLVGGTPREIEESVNEADWGPDGKSLAVVRVVEGEYQLEYPRKTVLYKAVAPAWIGNIRVSPKGDLVAFIYHPVLGDVSGSVMTVDRYGQTRVLSSGWRAARGVAWTPSGDEVWFSASLTRGQDLHAVTLSGRERSLQSGNGFHLCDISRDGRVLATTGRGESQGSHMIGGTVGSGREQDLSWFGWSTSADISADGKTLLFYEWGKGVESTSVFVRKLDGSNDPVELGHGKALALSSDGKWALALQEGPPHRLVLLPTGPGEPRILPSGEIVEYHYASWFPDGKQILFTG